MSQLEQFARRLREEPGFSRNRRFDELSRPEARAMRRRLRRLDGVARDLRQAGQVSLVAEGDGFRLVLWFEAVRARRETWLSAEEYGLLAAQGHLSGVARIPSPDAA